LDDLIIIESELFKRYDNLKFGFSTKIGGVSPPPLNLNLSYSTGDKPENVKINRRLFFKKLDIDEERVTFQKQVHSSNVRYSELPQFIDGCDAIYTDKKNNFLAVSVADCIPVFLYSPETNVIAGIHAGWKGTSAEIVFSTISKLKQDYHINCKKLLAYIGPGICLDHYEVGNEVAELFNEDEKKQYGDKYLLDLKKANFNQLVKSGLSEENIETSELCTYCNPGLFHSYRRDGLKAGRMLGIIGLLKYL